MDDKNIHADIAAIIGALREVEHAANRLMLLFAGLEQTCSRLYNEMLETDIKVADKES